MTRIRYRGQCECGRQWDVAQEIVGRKATSHPGLRMRCPDCGQTVWLPAASGVDNAGPVYRGPTWLVAPETVKCWFPTYDGTGSRVDCA